MQWPLRWLFSPWVQFPASSLRIELYLRQSYWRDYFDATINRIGAYVIGCRATQKAFIQALLEPSALLNSYEENGQYFERLALQEEAKSLPWNAVWDYYCLQNNVPVGENYITEIQKYEQAITSKR